MQCDKGCAYMGIVGAAIIIRGEHCAIISGSITEHNASKFIGGIDCE